MSSESKPAVEPHPEVASLSNAEDIGLEAIELPSDAAKIFKFSFDEENRAKKPQQIIGNLTVQMINQKRSLTFKERQMVYNIIKAVGSIETVTPATDQLLQIRWMMKSVLGESPRAKGPYEFPAPFSKDAAIVLAKVEADLEVEEVIEDVISPIETLTLGNSKANKRKRGSEDRTVSGFDPEVYEDVMRDILVVTGGRRAYQLEDKSAAKSCNVIGNNALVVGQWWPFRICAIRDGAHGAVMAGIAGGETTGAFSVVVSGEQDSIIVYFLQCGQLLGQYADLDQDNGDVLYYSGSNSHSNEDSVNPVLSHATKALKRSNAERRSIRVLRGSGGSKKFCPSVGLRYDGLYHIVSEEVRKNMNGGAYIRFKMVRDGGQVDIDMRRPNKKERDIFDKLKDAN